jgi:hypothetical protein
MKIRLALYFSAIIIILTTFGISGSFFYVILPLVYGIESSNYSTVEKNTKLFLEKSQQSGAPPLYTLTPNEAQ